MVAQESQGSGQNPAYRWTRNVERLPTGGLSACKRARQAPGVPQRVTRLVGLQPDRVVGPFGGGTLFPFGLQRENDLDASASTHGAGQRDGASVTFDDLADQS